MKQEMQPPQNTQEHRANQLWSEYDSQGNEEKFWQRYERLLKNKSNFPSVQTTSVETPLPSDKDDDRVVFKAPDSHYFRSGLMLFIIFFAGLLITINISAAIKNGGIVFLALFSIFTLVSFHFLWQYNTFTITSDFLLVQKKTFFVKHSFAWKDIKSMSIEQKTTDNSSFLVLVINARHRKTSCFKFPLADEAQSLFVQQIRRKNISIAG